MNKLTPVVLYCHGLGATVQSGIALVAKKFVESRGLQFKSVEYQNSGRKNCIWNVDDWLNDLLVSINECSKQQRLCLLFEFWEKILAGKNVPHPSAGKNIPPIMINQQCLQHFVDTCISNRMASIPIHCPVRIMHGSDDKIVPLSNVKKFKEKLESKDVILSIINGSGHYLPIATEFEELFDSLLGSL
ncbi:Uncharacterized protein BM_BM9155 [Brugia malayi]|uniref:Serine aminopeptidase S33 domain-containing protein n=1 Tax=Brugia malayi TaxID=6279 RepID=A0A4E9FCC4_BRUMA|nr:Uncharacterized protein BM_BM9155 [Brugia malayi]VIO94042.1 Uncharacterized protein BM_BM9155 [Brugia malayi]